MIASPRSSTRRCSTASPSFSWRMRVRGPALLLGTTTSRRLTFCRQFIRAVFSWPTKQPLVKLTPFSSAALHSSQRTSPSSARPSQTPRRSRCSSQPRSRLVGLAEPSSPKLLQPRVGAAGAALQRPMHRNSGLALDTDRSTQPVDRQPLHKVVRRLLSAVEKQALVVGPDDEVEKAFALRRQQSGPNRKLAQDVVRHQSLQEAVHVLARETDDCAVGQGGSGHGLQLGSRP